MVLFVSCQKHFAATSVGEEYLCCGLGLGWIPIFLAQIREIKMMALHQGSMKDTVVFTDVQNQWMQDGKSTLVMQFYNGLIFFQFINNNVKLFLSFRKPKESERKNEYWLTKDLRHIRNRHWGWIWVDTFLSVEDKYVAKTIIKKVHREQKNKSWWQCIC